MGTMMTPLMVTAGLLLLGTLVALYAVVKLDPFDTSDLDPPKLGPHWWGPGSAPSTEPVAQLERFTISVPDKKLKDLRRQLKDTVYPEPLEGVGFEYGFNEDYLRDVIVHHWLNEYNWTEQQAWLNSFEHWTTRIDGIRVHYIHARPQNLKDGVKVIPLMLVHGWPGSFVEFLELIPMLTTPRDGHVFEVVCPSIPGYGFSESPRRPGFGQVEAAQLMDQLMHQRLGFESYYVQGGDWGAKIVTYMSQLFPQRVRGVHVNLVFLDYSPSLLLKEVVGRYVPSLIGIDDIDYGHMYPFAKRLFFMLQESGYMHIQATKPDTVGLGLANSPAALAAYILEKFATWTNRTGVAEEILETKFGLNKLLTNIMVYWHTGSITSSQRFYKEHYSATQRAYQMNRVPVTVPAGVAAFPEEILPPTKLAAGILYRNLVSFTNMPRGGHFAAFEEPRLMADDIYRFVKIVETQ